MRRKLLAILACVLPLGSADASPIFFGPTPYLSAADTPLGLFSGPTLLEDFEDGVLSFGITPSLITASLGGVTGPGGFADSVDADDGTIDGSGTEGLSWHGTGGVGVRFDLPPGVTAAGMVWTDGHPAFETIFEAFGPGGSLGTISAFLGEGLDTGQTAEDRFFGVSDPGGITAIAFTFAGSGTALEVDHIQFGAAAVSAVPEPSSMALFGLGVTGLLGYARQRQGRANSRRG